MVSYNEIGLMLTVREVAQLIHIHQNTVRRWSDKGIIKSYRITHRGDRRFKQDDIASFMAEFTPYGNNQKRETPRGESLT